MRRRHPTVQSIPEDRATFQAPPGYPNLQIRVAGAQHGGETRSLFLAAALLARLFIMPMATDNAQRTFAINLLFEATQGFIHWLAFF